MEMNRFNIRVYGLIINVENEVLLSDEYVLDRYITKFPGGGLKFGEGPEDCIKREAIEEFGQTISIVEHFYTTGFFQKAFFFENQQLISIYYRIAFDEKPIFLISKKAFDFEETENEKQSFRWISVSKLESSELTLPVDQYVARL